MPLIILALVNWPKLTDQSNPNKTRTNPQTTRKRKRTLLRYLVLNTPCPSNIHPVIHQRRLMGTTKPKPLLRSKVNILRSPIKLARPRRLARNPLTLQKLKPPLSKNQSPSLRSSVLPIQFTGMEYWSPSRYAGHKTLSQMR